MSMTVGSGTYHAIWDSNGLNVFVSTELPEVREEILSQIEEQGSLHNWVKWQYTLPCDDPESMLGECIIAVDYFE